MFLTNVATMAEFTILDAPETPAPVFAFRALKGVIFGSPNDDERNKENATTPKQIPTLRSKISALAAPPVSPSKRRKTNQYASPAKSILITPGIPTPRRQNANVTFKDVTPSNSPEIMRKGPTGKERLFQEDQKSAAVALPPRTKQAPPAAVPDKPTVVPQVSTKNRAVPPSAVLKEAGAAFDVEAYKLSAEKEMKKLVRYGQKMREYARKQDEENTKLRIAVEKLQQENEELRKREGVREGARQRKQGEKEAHREVAGVRPGSNTIEELESGKRSRSAAERTNALPTSTAYQSNGISRANASLPKTERSSPLKRKASTQLRPESSPARTSKTASQPVLLRHDEVSTEDAPTSGAGTVRLPLDRVAAARERIRLKAELRRKNTAGTFSPVNWDGL